MRVVVCNWDRWDLLHLHLLSHRLFSPPEVEIVIVDQGGGLSLARCRSAVGHDNLTIRKDPTEPANYSVAHNLGAEGTNGIAIFLNDDVVVTPLWADHLLIVEEMIRNQDPFYGLVGMRATNISGPQAIDSELDRNAITPCPRVVTGAAWCQYDSFLQAGGFDDRFPYSWSDDALSQRFLAAGYSNYIGPPLLLHIGNVSSLSHGIDVQADISHYQALFEEHYEPWQTLLSK